MSIDPDSGNATSPRIFSRRRALGGMAGAAFALALRRELGRALTAPPVASPDGDPLPSWNEGAAKDAILAFVEQLSEVNVDGVEPMTSVTPMVMKKRKDAVTDGGIAGDVLRNAPAREGNYFAVPKVVE